MSEEFKFGTWYEIGVVPKDDSLILFWDGRKMGICRADDFSFKSTYLQDVTHWMPLPTSPITPEFEETP